MRAKTTCEILMKEHRRLVIAVRQTNDNGVIRFANAAYVRPANRARVHVLPASHFLPAGVDQAMPDTDADPAANTCSTSFTGFGLTVTISQPSARRACRTVVNGVKFQLQRSRLSRNADHVYYSVFHFYPFVMLLVFFSFNVVVAANGRRSFLQPRSGHELHGSLRSADKRNGAFALLASAPERL